MIKCQWEKTGQLFFLSLLVSVLVITSLYSQENIQGSPWGLTLSVSPATIVFNSADPDLQPVIQANTSIRVMVTAEPQRSWNLQVRAEGNLVSNGGKVIPINCISWTATPNPPFGDGVLSPGQNIMLISQARGNIEGELFFYFRNSWEQAAGEYNQVISFTVSWI